MACAYSSLLAEESLGTILRCLKPGKVHSLPGICREAGSGDYLLPGRWLHLPEVGGVCSPRPCRRSSLWGNALCFQLVSFL